ncbi:MAG: AraC family transcriptional regulator [Paenibacillaceae bacterium]|jgi:AraC-like DNA-binding protein|nr:AraC family transcriptional regulator [Paenibacillaceae bacterium]
MHELHTLLANPPVINQTIDEHLARFPLYLRDHSMHAPRSNMHIQAGVEISVTHEGTATFVVGESVYMQTPGSLMVVPGNIPHHIYSQSTSRYRRTVLCFDDGELAKDATGLLALIGTHGIAPTQFCHLTLPPEIFTELRRLTSRMQAEMDAQLRGWKQMILSQFMDMGVMLQRVIEEHHVKQTAAASLSNRQTEIVEGCSQFIEHHLYDDLSLERMSKLMSVSQEHLTRCFRKYKGTSYYQYVLLRRVMESRRLLRECPGMSLTGIAYAVGFPSSSQFSRMFKSIVKMTPSEYRLAAPAPDGEADI